MLLGAPVFSIGDETVVGFLAIDFAILWPYPPTGVGTVVASDSVAGQQISLPLLILETDYPNSDALTNGTKVLALRSL